MADDVVDRLVVEGQFNPGNLDQMPQIVRDQLAQAGTAITQANRALPPLTIRTDTLQTALRAAGSDVSQFFSTFSAGAAKAAADANRFADLRRHLAGVGSESTALAGAYGLATARSQGLVSVTDALIARLQDLVRQALTAQRALSAPATPGGLLGAPGGVLAAPKQPLLLTAGPPVTIDTTPAEASLDRLADTAARDANELQRAGQQIATDSAEWSIAYRKAVIDAMSSGAAPGTSTLNRIGQDVRRAQADFAAGKIAVDDYRTAVAFARKELQALGSQGASPFARIAQDAERARADFKAGAISIKDYTVALENARAEMAAFQTLGLQPSRRELVAITGAAERGARAYQSHTRAANLTRNSLVVLASQAVGTSSTLGQLAQSALLFAGGSTAVIAGAIGLLGVVKVFEAITANARAAKKATDDAIASLLELRKQQREPERVRLEETGDANRRLDELRTKIQALAAEQRKLLDQPIVFGDRGGDQTAARLTFVTARLAQLGKQFRDTGLAAETGGQAVQQAAVQAANALRQFQESQLQARVSPLAAAPGLGLETAVVREQINAEIQRNRLIVAGNAPLTERIQAQQNINALLDGTLARTERLVATEQQAAQQASALFQRLTQQAQRPGASPTIKLDVADARDSLRSFEQLIASEVVRVDQLRAGLDSNTEAARRLGQTSTGLRQLRDALQDTLRAADPTPLERLLQASTDLGTRLTALRGNFADVGAQERAALAGSVQLAETYRQLSIEIARHGGLASASTATLQAAAAVLQSLGQSTQPFTAGLGLAITALQDAEQATRDFLRTGDLATDLAIRVAIEVDTENARRGVEAFLRGLREREAIRLTIEIDQGFDKVAGSVATIDDALTKAAVQSNGVFRKMKRDIEDNRTSAEKLSDAFADVSRAISGLQSIGNQLGILDEQTNQVIDGLSEAAEAGARFAAGDILGGIVSGIGAIASIGQGLFGPSADEKEAQRVLRENTQAIRENTIQRSEGFTGIGGAADASAILRQVIASQRGQELIPDTQEGGDEGRAARQGLVDELAKLGLSFTDLQRLAEEFGITILERGKLVGGALGDLADEITASLQAQLRFRQTFDEQLQAADLRARITGAPDDATARFQRELEVAGKLGATAITDAFSGVDLRDADATGAALLTLLNAFEQGTLDAEDLGKLSREDFLKFLDSGAASLEEFRDSVNEATKASLNIPQGFRLAALAFQASDLGPPPGATPSLPPGLTPNIDPGRRFPTTFDVPGLDVAATLAEIASQTPADLLAVLNGLATNAQPDLLDALHGLGERSPGDLLAELGTISGSIDHLAAALGLPADRLPAPTAPGGNGSSFRPPDVRTTATTTFTVNGLTLNVVSKVENLTELADELTDLVIDGLRQKSLRQGGDTLNIGSPT